jgi:1-pyrroline-5-carboxylate dehydrogenase
VKSAFGLQGQKCSACSRVYADRRIHGALLERILAKTAEITIGDPTERDIYFGPVINAKAVRAYEEAVVSARTGGGMIHAGGARLTNGALAKGNYVSPTVAELPLEHDLFRRELFLPFLSVAPVSGLEQAI